MRLGQGDKNRHFGAAKWCQMPQQRASHCFRRYNRPGAETGAIAEPM
jgi:hypothetical protein